MKELTIEEKAKAYDKAIESMKDWITYVPVDEIARYYILNTFPELKESDDKEIQKELITFLSQTESSTTLNKNRKRFRKMIAWVEKQDKQNPADKVEPKFNIGDIIFNKTTNEQFTITGRSLALQYYHDKDHLHEVRFSEQDEWEIIKQKFHEGDWIITPNNQIKQIKSVSFGNYRFTDGSLYNIIDVDNKGHLWTIADAKDGDVLVYGDNPSGYHVKIIMLFKSMRTVDSAFNHFHIFDDEFRINDWCDCGKSAHPATKEERELLFAKMRDAGYEWNAEKKLLKKIEQKSVSITDEWIEDYWQHEKVQNPYSYDKGEEIQFDHQGFVSFCKKYCQKPAEWSEKDEEYLNFVIAAMKTLQVKCTENEIKHHSNSQAAPYYGKVINWLKSLKPQPKQEWSEEDEKKLNRIYTLLAEAADKHAFSTTCRLIGDKECVELQDFLRSLRPQTSKR